jgi:hypothetical protein
MAITPDNFKWADSNINDGTTGQPNKVPPDTSQKSSGLLREEPIARPHLNYQFDQYHKAFIDLQTQINSIVADAGSAVLQKAFPVGSVYTSTTSITNPSDAGLLGFGTWTRLKGRFLVGIDEADTSFDGLGETGGSKVHTHTNTLAVSGHVLSTSELPNFSLSYRDRYYLENGGRTGNATFKESTPTNYNGGLGPNANADLDNNTFLYIDSQTESIGNNQAHTHGITGGINSTSNLPPYYSAYMWRRTA